MEQNSRIAMLLQYLEEDPGDAFSKYALALEYVKSGDDSAAFNYMEALFLQQPDYLPNYYHFGKLLERQNKNNLAAAAYQKGIITARAQNDMHTLSELQGAIDGME